MKETIPQNSKDPGRIERLRIPDSDMAGWIEALRKSDLTEEQIDRMLTHLNRNYADAKGVDNIVEEELGRLREYLLKEHQQTLSPEQEEYLRKSIESRLP